MFSAGRNAALSAYGLKTAGFMDHARTFGSWVREGAIGAPGTWESLGQQARTGTLTAPPPAKRPGMPQLPGGHYHNALGWLIPKFDFGRKGDGFLSRGLSTANSAFSAAQPLLMAHAGYRALTAPPEVRGEATGALVGGVLGGTLGSPFGVVGNMVGGGLGATAGGLIGNAVSLQRDPEGSF